MLRRNESKLAALENMRTKSGNLDAEALEVFLKKYVVGVPTSSQGKKPVESSRLRHSTNQDEVSIPDTTITDTNETIIETLHTPLLPSRGYTDLSLDLPILQIAVSEDEKIKTPSSRVEKTADVQQGMSIVEEPPSSGDTLDLEMKRMKDRFEQVPSSPSVDNQSQTEVESTKTLLTDTQWVPAL